MEYNRENLFVKFGRLILTDLLNDELSMNSQHLAELPKNGLNVCTSPTSNLFRRLKRVVGMQLEMTKFSTQIAL